MGDKGFTNILEGKKIPKSDEIIDAIGQIDELNAYIGISLLSTKDDYIDAELKRIQNELFTIGTLLASVAGKKYVKFDSSYSEKLESSIHLMEKDLPQLRNFVLPGGSVGSAHLHYARTIARRAERSVLIAAKKYEVGESVIAYLNRISSFLFVAALYLNNKHGISEANPKYEKV